MSYCVHIGLEIHVHLNTNTKMFCGCRAQFGEEANAYICPVCMGLPGTLPVPNKEAIVKAIQIIDSLQCKLAETLVFDRKNYFYPDMPKNYQISQYRQPVGGEGKFSYYYAGELRHIAIRELHLEEDAGKLVHAESESYVDYNRAGYPLVEIVTQPELRSPEETEAMIRQFHKTIQYLDVSDATMEEGSFRCDANISLSKDAKTLGAKVEIKNLNSFHFVKKALLFEIERQTELLNEGMPVKLETRLWNANKDITEGMRSKEEVHDYRYFQEPDIPEVSISQDVIKAAKEKKLVLPVSRLVDLLEQYRLSEQVAMIFVDEKEFGDMFYRLCESGLEAQAVAQWLAGDLRGSLSVVGSTLGDVPIRFEDLKEFFELLQEELISGRKAKQLIHAMTEGKGSPRNILKAEGWTLITDEVSIKTMAEEVCDTNPTIIEQIKSGSAKGVDFLMGALMRLSKGQIQPQRGKEILQRVVDERTENSR